MKEATPVTIVRLIGTGVSQRLKKSRCWIRDCDDGSGRKHVIVCLTDVHGRVVNGILA